MRTRLLAFAIAILALSSLTGCQLTKQEAPPLAGPSGLGTSMTLTASPDRLQQDGVSSTRVEATVFRANGERWNGLRLNWRVSANDGSFVEPSTMDTVTDANGRASTIITSPAPPARIPSTPLVLTVVASSVSNDAATVTRSIDVAMVPPAGTPAPNNEPVGEFTYSPLAPTLNQNVVFDASTSKDEGATCGAGCTYAWDFGDGATGSGIVVGHTYAASGTYVVKLVVTDARGLAGAAVLKGVTVGLPAAPTAQVDFSPQEPSANQSVTLDAGDSTAGSGATITQYTWSFGDGSPDTNTTGSTTQHTYTAAGTYLARVTVRDSFGRTATATVLIEVAP